MVAFRFTDGFKQKYPEIKQKWIQTLLRSKGWYVRLESTRRALLIDSYIRIVPNYELAPNLESIDILRVVVRENLSEAVCLSSSVHAITVI